MMEEKPSPRADQNTGAISRERTDNAHSHTIAPNGANSNISFSTFPSETNTTPTALALPWSELRKRLSMFTEQPTKGGALWSPTIYRNGATRSNDGVLWITCAVADYDVVTDYGAIAEGLRASGCAFAHHSTYRSTPEAPRLRVVMPLARLVPAGDWRAVYRRIAYHLFPGAEPHDDPARAYYWPQCPAGAIRFHDGQHGTWLDPYSLPEVSAISGNGNGHKVAEPMPQQIGQGERNGVLTSLAGTMRRRGASQEAIEAALIHENATRCAPPLAEREVLQIARSVSRYEPNTKQARALQIEIRSHDELMTEAFPPVQWIIDQLVPENGLTMLAGRKKLGKSWLALQIAQGVAQGVRVLGRDTTQGVVVYLALEDGPQRLQARLQKQQAKRGLPIHYVTRFAPLDCAGLDQLEKLIDTIKPRLVIIDTLAAAKTGRTDENAAGDMGDLLNNLRRLAQDTNTAVVVIAHHGKASLGDPGFDIRGSSAVAGASDVNIGLYKVEDSAARILKAEGRDIEDVELRIEFDAVHTWCWQLVGDARQIARDETDEEILEAINTLTEADAGAVGQELGKTRQAATRALKRLVKDGRLVARAEKTGRQTKVLYSKNNDIGITHIASWTAVARVTPVAASKHRPDDVRCNRCNGETGHMNTCTDCGKLLSEGENGQCEPCRVAWLEGQR